MVTNLDGIALERGGAEHYYPTVQKRQQPSSAKDRTTEKREFDSEEREIIDGTKLQSFTGHPIKQQRKAELVNIKREIENSDTNKILRVEREDLPD